MHRVLILAFLGLMLASAARAADVATRHGYTLPPRCANFSGFYLGGQLGWGYYDTTFSDRDGLGQSIDNGLPNSVNATTSRVNLGPLAGYSFQSGCMVYGFEADWSWTSLRASEHSLDGGQGPAGAADSVTATSKLQWFGTLRARTGIVVDNLLLYATGGIAYANFDRTWSFFEDVSATTTNFTSQKTLFGWTGGVGTEWTWTPNWSLKSEVLYMRFTSDDARVTGVPPAGVAGVTYRLGSQDSVWIIRCGLNYRWGGR
ncbi:MAG: outer membrane beta-barrel protein [Xanthobacteraceae bacterium]